MKINMKQIVFFLGILLIQQCSTVQASDNDKKLLIFQQIKQLQELLQDLRDSDYLKNQSVIMTDVNNALSQTPTPDISSYQVGQLDRFKNIKKIALEKVLSFLKESDSTGNVFMIIRIQNVLNALNSDPAESLPEPSKSSAPSRKFKHSAEEGVSILENSLKGVLRQLPVASAPSFGPEKENAVVIVHTAQEVEELFTQAMQETQEMFEKQLLDYVTQQAEVELAMLQQEHEQLLAGFKQQELQAAQQLQQSAATILQQQMRREVGDDIKKSVELMEQKISEEQRSTDALMKAVELTQPVVLENANKANLEKAQKSIAEIQSEVDSVRGKKIVRAASNAIEATQAQLKKLETEARKAKIPVNSGNATVYALQEKLLEDLQKALAKNSAKLVQILKDLEVSRVTSETVKQVFDQLKGMIHGFESQHNQFYIQGYLQGLLLAHSVKPVSYVTQLDAKEVEKLLMLLNRVQTQLVRARA
ncbi:hypothetical protein KBD08_04360 [Candidatus Babeliales bacterium]|nr:hypothetical protein [Candidatus Babeliales bacterium]